MSQLIFPAGHTHHRCTFEDAQTYSIQAAWEANFVWTGREDYLEWVAAWKACLHQKIAAIRAERAIRRDQTREIQERNAANLERQQLRIDCHNLLVLRKIGKIAAAAQRNDRRNSLAA